MRNYNIDVIFVGIYGSYIIKHLYVRFSVLISHSIADFEDFQSEILAVSFHFCFSLKS